MTGQRLSPNDSELSSVCLVQPLAQRAEECVLDACKLSKELSTVRRGARWELEGGTKFQVPLNWFEGPFRVINHSTSHDHCGDLG